MSGRGRGMSFILNKPGWRTGEITTKTRRKQRGFRSLNIFFFPSCIRVFVVKIGLFNSELHGFREVDRPALTRRVLCCAGAKIAR